MRKTFATFKTVVRSAGSEPEITISTRALDRDGDVIEPSGGDFGNYLKNPVVLFGHDHHSLPIGRAKGLSVHADGIRATFSWLTNDHHADRVRNAFDQGVVNAASIGFIPRKWVDIAGSYGRRYTDWELLEFSIVPVPSNPEAVRTLKALGLGADDPDFLTLEPDVELTKGYVAREVGRVVPGVLADEVRRAINRATGRVD